MSAWVLAPLGCRLAASAAAATSVETGCCNKHCWRPLVLHTQSPVCVVCTNWLTSLTYTFIWGRTHKPILSATCLLTCCLIRNAMLRVSFVIGDDFLCQYGSGAVSWRVSGTCSTYRQQHCLNQTVATSTTSTTHIIQRLECIVVYNIDHTSSLVFY